MKFVVKFIFFLSFWCSVKAKCRMRGNCAVIDGYQKPCPVNEEASSLTLGLSEEEATDAMNILRHRCPNLFLDDEGNTLPNEEVLTCCTAEQVYSMSESMTLSDGILGRCPTCLRNFARQICEMNCSPDQSRFVDVYTEVGPDGVEYVDEIEYRMHEDFMYAAHASCAGVIVPQTGLPAINLMCGNAIVCDAETWFKATGDAAGNPFVPVQVNFMKTETEENSMNVRALPCNETYGDDLPCSCMDCITNCPVGNEPVVPNVCKVFSVNCIGFSVGIVFFVISVTIFIIIALLEYRSKMRQDNTQRKDRMNLGPNKLTQLFQIMFAKIGGFSASHPVLVIMITTWIGFGMFFGLLSLKLTAHPLDLWSAPDSRSRQELEYFNTRFGPFYRASQVFLTFDLEPFVANDVTYGPAFHLEAVEELVKLENAIINIGREDGGVVLEDVCYAPLRGRGEEAKLEQCVSMSVSIYFGDDKNNINSNTYLNTIQNCINNHYALNCLATWGGGSEPEITFGGYEESNILSANTLLINFPLANHLTQQDLQPVLEWEAKFIELLRDYQQNWKSDYVTVAFGTERSVEDEILRVSVAEAFPITISYLIMFIYVILSLGNIRSIKTCFIDSKVAVALGSILVVLFSIYCAMCTLGYSGITTTLLAINVIPFFVLSVGIDNVFLMVNTLSEIQNNLKSFDEYKEHMSFEKKRRFVFEKMLGKVGPSMFVSSITQITCFGIGALANFPAVKTFAIFVSISLAFLFIFQVTTIIAILSIDYKRSIQNRFDIFCCIQKKILNDDDPLHSSTPYKGITQRLMEPYAKILLKWRVKIVVAILFMFFISVSVILIPQIEVGLDQELALPPDSYVYAYLQAVNNIMRIGPPVYFIVKGGLNYSNPDHQNTICGGQLCYEDSLTTQIFLASQYSNVTTIAATSNSWLDDFVDWTALYGGCCKYNITDGGFCQSMDSSPECQYCVIDRDEYANGLRPSTEAFEKYIPFFLRDEPTEICNKGGLASYSGAVNYILDSEGKASIYETHFMTYHTPVGTSSEYINAVKFGYELSSNISSAIKNHTGLDIEVFPYSVFYVFYEQYLNMWQDTFVSIAYCMIGAMVLNLLASGFNVMTTFAVIINAIMVVISMMGVMYIWNIPLNAVSCVNLIVSIGISVEFSSHIAYAFSTSSAKDRVADAIESVGATIITGITFTNIPIIVLAFSYTEIIEIFFFRMFFSLVILGCLHGMVFFPVLLSYLEYLFKK